MSDNIERLRARDEHLAQWAAGEIDRTTTQRDELLAVLQGFFNEHGEFEYTPGTLMQARTILSKYNTNKETE